MTYDPHTDWGVAPVIEQTGTTPKPRTTRTSGEVVDLLAALQRSVDAAKADRRAQGDPDQPGSHHHTHKEI
jgi:non-homologous end joining protein Ku